MKKSILFISLLALAACKSADQKAAESLLQQAKELMANKNYTTAIALLDSLNVAYPEQIDERYESTVLKARAMREYTEQQTMVADSIIALLTPQMEAYEGKFEHVPGKDGMAGYFVAKEAYVPVFTSTTGIEARVSDADYSFYMAASSSDKQIGIIQIVLDTEAGAAAKSEALDPSDSRSGDTDKFGIDLATFTTSEVAELAQWAADNASKITAFTLIGKEGEITKPMSPGQAEAIGQAWNFSQIAFRLHHARVLSEKLNRQIIIARDHDVNLEGNR